MQHRGQSAGPYPRWEPGTFTFVPFGYRPLRANFDNALELLACEMDSQRFRPVDDIHLALQGQALVYLEKDYHAFVHLLDDRNQVGADHDKVPLDDYFWATD